MTKYLKKLLSQLSQSDYAIKNTKKSVGKMRKKHVPDSHMMVSLEVKSPFTKVLLETTIDITFKRVYERNETSSLISKKQVLKLCEKNDGVAMGSALGPVLVVIFMTDLEYNIIPTLSGNITFSRRFVNEKVAFLKNGGIDCTFRTVKQYPQNDTVYFRFKELQQFSFILCVAYQKTNTIDTKCITDEY